MNTNLTAGIVRIIKPNDQTAGTGFVATDKGLIVTCAHVIESARAKPGDNVQVALYAIGEFGGASAFATTARRVVGIVAVNMALDRYERRSDTAFITPTGTLRAVCPALQISDIYPYRSLNQRFHRSRPISHSARSKSNGW